MVESDLAETLTSSPDGCIMPTVPGGGGDLPADGGIGGLFALDLPAMEAELESLLARGEAEWQELVATLPAMEAELGRLMAELTDRPMES